MGWRPDGLVPPHAGRKGKRSARHARIMMHQPSGGTQGTAADIEIQARESSTCAPS